MEKFFRKTFIYSNNSTLVQLLRYVIVGGFASAADISIFYIAAASFGLNHIIANTLSFLAGLLINYILSTVWVFGQSSYSKFKGFFLFCIIGILGLMISNLILYMLIDYRILYHILPILGEDFVKLMAKLCAVVIVLLWNFTARKKLVFNAA